MDAESGTVLRFDGQTTGAQSLLATGDNFVVQDLAIENSPGDAIKVNGANGVTIRRVRVEWTNGPDVAMAHMVYILFKPATCLSKIVRCGAPATQACMWANQKISS